jgi:hypothetical protein
MNLSPERPMAPCARPQPTCRKVLDDLLTPNGMAWSDDKSRCPADTRRGQIYAFIRRDVRHARRAQNLRRPGAMPGGPDGDARRRFPVVMTADARPPLPDGHMDQCQVAGDRPTCAGSRAGFSPALRDTATRGLGDDDLRAEPLAGRMLVLDVGVAGRPPIPFVPTVLPAGDKR